MDDPPCLGGAAIDIIPYQKRRRYWLNVPRDWIRGYVSKVEKVLYWDKNVPLTYGGAIASVVRPGRVQVAPRGAEATKRGGRVSFPFPAQDIRFNKRAKEGGGYTNARGT